MLDRLTEGRMLDAKRLPLTPSKPGVLFVVAQRP